jgi:peroxiredoxin
MKRTIICLLAALPVFGYAQNGQYTIKGKIGQMANQGKAYLAYGLDGKYVRDSAIIKNGEFEFKGIIAYPVHAQLTVDHQTKTINTGYDIVTFYLAKGTTNVTARDSIKNAKITGSRINTENQEYQAAISVPQNVMQGLANQYRAAPDPQKNDPKFMDTLNQKFDKAYGEKKEVQKEFIKKHSESYLSLIVLEEMVEDAKELDVATLEPLYKNLSADVRNSVNGKKFSASIEVARVTSIGAIAPDFTQNDVNDKPVSLKEFRGKYVLLDFWASWCGPCRGENPNVVKAYDQYKEKNFAILSVSLDRPGKKDAWLAAIKADGLEWTQVSDLQFWNNAVAKQYGITSIPQNFLIDPTGKIIAKNLRGDDLEKKLATLFN